MIIQDRNAFANRVQVFRRANGLTQAELAELVGVIGGQG